MNFVPRAPGGTAAVARELATLADRDPASVRLSAGSAGEPPAEGDIHHGVSFLPPTETTLERFLRERRLARTEGERGVERREDEVRMEDTA
jgi:dTDP-4-dehydrorhamnose reductase